MESSDEQLVDLAIAGDADSLTELLRKHGPAVRRTLTAKIDTRWQGSRFSLKTT